MPNVIGRPDDHIVEGIRIFLRMAHRNLTRREWIEAMQWDRRVQRTLPWSAEERRSA